MIVYPFSWQVCGFQLGELLANFVPSIRYPDLYLNYTQT
jgi:hypothetical protein